MAQIICGLENGRLVSPLTSGASFRKERWTFPGASKTKKETFQIKRNYPCKIYEMSSKKQISVSTAFFLYTFSLANSAVTQNNKMDF